MIGRTEPHCPAFDPAIDPAKPDGRLPDALTASIQQAIHDWDQGALQASHAEFEHVVELARQMQYL